MNQERTLKLDFGIGRHYSPSATENFLHCPVYWGLKKLYVPRTKSIRWEPNLLLGQVVHSGMEAWAQDHPDPEQVVTQRLEREYVLQSEWTLEALTSHAVKAFRVLRDAMEAELAGVSTILAAELELGETRLDLVTRGSSGVSVWDYKTSLSLRSDYVAKRQLETLHSWQAHHIAWAAREYYQEPGGIWVKIPLVAMTPRCKAWIDRWFMTDAMLDHWYESAKIVWEDMWRIENNLKSPHMNLRSCFKWGKWCEYGPFCHNCTGDATLATQSLFDRVIRED